jgi:hypothetical protein
VSRYFRNAALGEPGNVVVVVGAGCDVDVVGSGCEVLVVATGCDVLVVAGGAVVVLVVPAPPQPAPQAVAASRHA